MIDIVFFQASATVIPTLLIATALTSRLSERLQFEEPKTDDPEDQQSSISHFVYRSYFVATLLGVALTGEAAALAALTSHKTRNLYFFLVTAAILYIFLALAVFIVFEFLDKLEDIAPKASSRVLYVLIGSFTIGIVLILAAAIPGDH